MVPLSSKTGKPLCLGLTSGGLGGGGRGGGFLGACLLVSLRTGPGVECLLATVLLTPTTDRGGGGACDLRDLTVPDTLLLSSIALMTSSREGGWLRFFLIWQKTATPTMDMMTMVRPIPMVI